MFIGMFHLILRALSLDLLEKKLRITTWGVFKAFAVSFHPTSVMGVIVLAASVSVCVHLSRTHRRTDRHTDLNFGM